MDQEKPSPLWKWGAAAGALYFAYSLGFDDGKSAAVVAHPPSSYASYEVPAASSVAAYAPAAPARDTLEEPDETPLATASAYAPSLDAPAGSASEYYYVDQSGNLVDAGAVATANGAGSAEPASQAASAVPQASPTAQASPLATSSISSATAWSPPSPGLAAGALSAAAAHAFAPCAENGSCYGDVSEATGRPKTVSVRGYYRRDGTYVRGYYRSH